ncbi:winged helix-turn-helix transcriptional regulator [Halorarius litoreus]|uniref:winged helix-turn-helix transcriptional regulator n=1 Tax=Halorarius litoreus TaxID=2962676 RepID=UPI0020CD99FF|nr:helix-turn-helix domain-containing protein [Halorarius litoreus]
MTLPHRLLVVVVVVALLGTTATAVTATTGIAPSTDSSVATSDHGGQFPTSADSVADLLVDRTVETAEAVDDPRVLVALLGYSRVEDSDPMDHETRRAIYETVVSTPGIHLAGVADRIGVPASTVTYHSRVLHDEGLLDVRRMRGRTRLYPVSLAAESAALDAALAETSTAAVLLAVKRLEPASVRTLADELDRAASTVSHHLGRLADDDLVVRERDGEAVVTSLAPTVRETLAARN